MSITKSSLRCTPVVPGTPGTSVVNSKRMTARRRKSLRLQHSISLHIPVGDINNTAEVMNCYIEMPRQIFSLTYLQADETQNPESLASLDELKCQTWQTYLVGFIFNMIYQPAQFRSLCRAVNDALTTFFQYSNSTMTYHTEVGLVEHLNPTENDNQALCVRVIGRTDEDETVLYRGYLMSWCCPTKVNGVFLPILLCRGKAKFRTVIHNVLAARFDVVITRLILSQEDFVHLSTYCVIMLEENDDYNVSYCYKSSSGTITLNVAIQYLMKLWKKIHKDDSNEVDLDEILLFHEALESFYEMTFGIKIGSAHFQNVNVKGCFSLQRNSQMWFRSTKIMHVVLKYLSYLAIQRLKVKALNHVEKENISVNCTV